MIEAAKMTHVRKKITGKFHFRAGMNIMEVPEASAFTRTTAIPQSELV